MKILIELVPDNGPFRWRVIGDPILSRAGEPGFIEGVVGQFAHETQNEQLLTAWRDVSFAIAMHLHQRALEDSAEGPCIQFERQEEIAGLITRWGLRAPPAKDTSE